MKIILCQKFCNMSACGKSVASAPSYPTFYSPQHMKKVAPHGQYNWSNVCSVCDTLHTQNSNCHGNDQVNYSIGNRMGRGGRMGGRISIIGRKHLLFLHVSFNISWPEIWDGVRCENKLGVSGGLDILKGFKSTRGNKQLGGVKYFCWTYLSV